jgi:hypothetical protein
MKCLVIKSKTVIEVFFEFADGNKQVGELLASVIIDGKSFNFPAIEILKEFRKKNLIVL